MPRHTRPVTQADYDQVRDLHAEGKSRNEIARLIGRSGRTVSRLAAELGLSFERAGRTSAATEARKADAAAKRADLQNKALDAALKLADQTFAPCKAFNFGGRDNSYNDVQLDEPTFVDKRNIATALAAFAQTALKLAEFDKVDQAVSGVDAWLAAMSGGNDDE